MAAHAGEKARKAGDFKCTGCDEVVHVRAGAKIPKCACGAASFEERRNEPGHKRTSPSGMRQGEHRRAGHARSGHAR